MDCFPKLVTVYAFSKIYWPEEYHWRLKAALSLAGAEGVKKSGNRKETFWIFLRIRNILPDGQLIFITQVTDFQNKRGWADSLKIVTLLNESGI